MNRFVLMLLLLASPALAQGPTFFQQIHGCVETSVKYTEYATLAEDSKDTDKGAFEAFVREEADLQPSPGVKQLLIKLGELAWMARGLGHNVHQDAMDLYDECYNKLGTKV